MDLPRFLLTNGFIVALLFVSFLLMRRKARPPTRLKFKNDPRSHVFGQSQLKVMDQERKEKEMMAGEWSPSDSTDEIYNQLRQAKELNVMFNYNGYPWDAYEAFGLPAGSPIEEVNKSYQELKAQMDPESIQFIDAAYQAIIKKNQWN